uniref:ERCC4 domain-containing protein n=1 Tax=viral metagenome TaxID=1070528 RepID=A0A6C0I5B1_9ZZZZ
MLIRVDMREDALHGMFDMNLNQVPHDNKPTHVLRCESLSVGDVILSSADGQTDYIVFERKSLQDLAASIRDGRYKEQSLRLQAFPKVHSHNVVYIVEGDFARYNERFSKIGKVALQSAMCSLNYYKGFSVVRTMSIIETYEIIHSYANKLAASPAPYDVGGPAQSEEGGVGGACCPPPYCSVLKVKQIKCENITPQNIGEIMLCNIPGISNKTASAVMKKYTTLRALMDALKGSGDCLDDIRLETQRRLSKQCIQNIYNFLMA